ncbi:MAG: ATP-dependent helicase [Methylococcaceae bacterium]|nr:MAG: ATP-dependent helicase [Methylococcaceae bacterium]
MLIRSVAAISIFLISAKEKDQFMKLLLKQRQIIHQQYGTHLVISGAGCGCTEVMVQKTLFWISQGEALDTFALLDCNVSAYSLNQRLVAMTGKDSLKAITVDQFCLRQVDHAIGHVFDHFAEQYDIDRDNLYQSYHERATLKPSDNILYKAVRQINKRLQPYQLDGEGVTVDDAYWFFVDYPGLLKRCLRRYQGVAVDNFHNVTKQQARFLKQVSQVVPFLLVGGDSLQSLQAIGEAYPKPWETFLKLVKPTRHTLIKSFRLGRQHARYTNSLASGIIDSSFVRSTHDSSQPIYQSFLNSEQQHAYLQETIQSLLNQGVRPSDIAVLSRTKPPLFNAKLVLNKSHIATSDSFFYQQEVDECFTVLHALMGITKDLALEEATLSTSHLKRVMGYVGIEKSKQGSMLQRICEQGIEQLRVSRRDDRKQADRVLVLQQAIVDAAADTFVEAGIQRLVDAVAPFMRDYYTHSQCNLLLGLLSNIKLSTRNLTSWHKVDDYYTRPALFAEGVFLGTCHKALGNQWKHVFLINVVEGYYPLTKYNKSSQAIDCEQRLFYSTVTRASEQLYLLRAPVHNFHFKNNAGMSGQRSIAHSHFVAESPYVVDYKKWFTMNKKNEQLIETYYFKPTLF